MMPGATVRNTGTIFVDNADRRVPYTHQFTVGYERNLRRFSRFFVEGQDFVVPYLAQLDNTVTRTPNEYRERFSTSAREKSSQDRCSPGGSATR